MSADAYWASRNTSSMMSIEIEDALLIPKLDGYHSAVPIGLHEGAVIDFVRRELHWVCR